MTRPETPLSSKEQTVKRYFVGSISREGLIELCVVGDDTADCDPGMDDEFVSAADFDSLTTRLTQAEAEIERLTRLNEGLTHDFNTLLVSGSKVESGRDRLHAALKRIAQRHEPTFKHTYKMGTAPDSAYEMASAALSGDSSAPEESRSSSSEQLTADLATLLLQAGWKGVLDAQWEGLASAVPELRRLLTRRVSVVETSKERQRNEAKKLIDWLPITTPELIRLRNANAITFDKQANAITTCLIQLRELFAGSPEETSETFRQGIDRVRRELRELKRPVPDETLDVSKPDL